jgi:hypothetical protein
MPLQRLSRVGRWLGDTRGSAGTLCPCAEWGTFFPLLGTRAEVSCCHTVNSSPTVATCWEGHLAVRKGQVRRSREQRWLCRFGVLRMAWGPCT